MRGLTLKDVLRKVLFEGDLSARQLAEELGMSYSMLTNAANPDLPEFKFAARHIIPLTRATGDYRMIDFIEASVGRVAFSLPDQPVSLTDIDRLIAINVQQFGNALADIGSALEDGKVDRFEIKQIETSLNAQVRMAMGLLESLKRQEDKS